MKGISLRDMGSDINSDFNEKRFVDRQDSAAITVDQLKKFSEKDMNIMVNEGNAITLPYTKNILNIPTDSSHYIITDESIPFYQMVIHGFVEYAAEPVNLAQDYRENLLKTVESGAALYYTWIYADNSLVKETDFDYLYSANYKDWIKNASEFYKKINSEFKDIQDKRITAHQRLSENVFQTSYENGLSVIVNYNTEPVTVLGRYIKGRDYIVLKGGAEN